MHTIVEQPPSLDVLLHGLRFLWLEITAKCNLECLHCYADSGPQHAVLGCMKTADWLTVLREAEELGCQQVQFIGGEPTLHPDLNQLIAFASAHNYYFIEVFTNATALNEQLLQTLVDHHVYMATSFYTDDPVIHDAITQRQGSFHRTVTGIKRILAAGLPLRAGIIEMPMNVGHTLRAKRFLEDIGVRQIKIDFQRGIGRGAHAAPSYEPAAELCGECWKGTLCVTALGRAYPCVFSRFVDLGFVKHGMQRIVHGGPLFDFRTELRTCRFRRERADNSSQDNTPPILNRCDPCHPTCSPCDPISWCLPEGCNPDSAPCAPDRSCNPDQSCNPDRSCNPNHELTIWR
jgi:MoaA/NifB/PqqE/SkfB family radical SAM enzyme